jgi:hypothetical protein
LNKVTIKNRYPLPLISGLLEQLGEARVFTKIDLRGAYNLVRIKPGDEWKTAFRTRYGHFEYNVMPFGLTNAPAVFQHMMNNVFHEYLDKFVVAYIDDILVYSRTQEEHDHHVWLVLAKLREEGLYAKLEKCAFDQPQVEFLGFIVSSSGISMDRKKIQTILDWEAPTSVRDIQCFLGFANFYRRFIKDYSSIASPLTRLVGKDRPFSWTPDAASAFEALKEAFTTAPVLLHPDPSRPFFMETDASDFALGAVLSQYGEDSLLHPVAFHSRKFTAAEINYEIHDKELLAIVSAFEEWRRFLEGAPHQVTIYSDHKNLLYFMTSRVLNRRQARWALSLSRFDFVITYRPGIQQGKSDALSRRSFLAPKEGDAAYDQQNHILLRPEQFCLHASFIDPEADPLLQCIRDALLTDPLAKDILGHLSAPDSLTDKGARSDYELFEFKDGLLYREGLLYVPEGPARLKVLQARHDTPAAGHFGTNKTIELVSRDYWWPQLWKFVKDFVRTCDTCARSKTPRHLPYGLLQPLPIPVAPWRSISMDFITDLPDSQGFDSILVVVDRFTKMAHFIPCTKTITGEGTAKLLLNHVFRLHGLPSDIVSDRGPQFASKFWKRLFQLMGVQTKLSSAFHPETDGQTERTNQTLEQYLRCTINYQQDDWADWLPLAEFAYNNSLHSATQKTPFFANFGFHPRFDISQFSLPENPVAEDHAAKLVAIQAQLSKHLQEAQDRYKSYADRHRQEPPCFNVGDQVWLLRHHIKTTRPSDKLDYKRLGPFTITARVNNVAYRLQLHDSMKIHPVFHVSLLEPYHASTLPGRVPDPPPPITVHNTLEYEVSNILDSKIMHRRLFYLVDWVGYDVSERSWEPAENLVNAQEKIDEFHQHYPNKPRTAPRRTRRLRRR